jgi:hypothetical protein
MTRIRTNREPTFQRGACLGSGLREENGPFQGSPVCVVFLFGAGFSFSYVANERLDLWIEVAEVCGQWRDFV